MSFNFSSEDNVSCTPSLTDFTTVLADPVNAPSPRYWLLWPGTMLLLAGAFAEVFANWKAIYNSFKQLMEPLVLKFRHQDVDIDESKLIPEPCTPKELVPLWMWGGGMLISVIFTCIVMGVQWKLNVGQTLIALVFSFIFSFIGAESTGRTNITPVTSVGNAVQLVVGGTTHGHGTIQKQQLTNLAGGMLAVGASYQSAVIHRRNRVFLLKSLMFLSFRTC